MSSTRSWTDFRARAGRHAIVCLSGLFLFAFASCASREQAILEGSTGPSSGGFGGADDGGADGDVRAPMMCIATQCPQPFTTCPGGAMCEADLSSDPHNCGVCGNACPGLDWKDQVTFNMSVGCKHGSCERVCAAHYANCNNADEDGCEVDLWGNPNNCGGCGVVCPSRRCVFGQCACNPETPTCPCPQETPNFCSPSCTNFLSDSANCGACGHACSPCQDDPATAHVAPDCQQGGCILACANGWLDCDHDLGLGCGHSNGCETAEDPNNCGVCGRTCPAGQLCRPLPPLGTSLGCVTPATCASNEESCPTNHPPGIACVDPDNDPQNCGGCGIRCDALGGHLDPNTTHIDAVCRHGICDVDCRLGWGDCDGAPTNGCESNLRTDQRNCGACGMACDYAQGQPCIRGQCLMTECDAGPGPQ